MDRNKSPTMLPENDEPREDTILSHQDTSNCLSLSTGDNGFTQDQTEHVDQRDGAIVESEQQDRNPFVQLVRDALDEIPAEFHDKMQNLIVLIEDEPDPEALHSTETRPGYTLLGLYHGVPITALGYQPAPLPQRITIYQNTIERYCNYNPDRVRAQVRATVLHEVAHHFGISHDDMPIWVR